MGYFFCLWVLCILVVSASCQTSFFQVLWHRNSKIPSKLEKMMRCVFFIWGNLVTSLQQYQDCPSFFFSTQVCIYVWEGGQSWRHYLRTYLSSRRARLIMCAGGLERAPMAVSSSGSGVDRRSAGAKFWGEKKRMKHGYETVKKPYPSYSRGVHIAVNLQHWLLARVGWTECCPLPSRNEALAPHGPEVLIANSKNLPHKKK